MVDEARNLKKESLLFKVDFEKMYVSIDWNDLDTVTGRVNFPNLSRKWIHECVGTTIASVLVSGSPTCEFPIERGLREGDPFSTFFYCGRRIKYHDDCNGR